MQRVSGFLPAWDKRSSGSKSTSSRSWWPNRSSSGSVNGLAKINIVAANNARVQKEAFWPATLDLECDKAARIVKSFCTDGYLAPEDDSESSESPASNEPTSPLKVTKKIPKRIIQNAAGIAVFTCMRSGLWMTGSGGSGILIARKSDGTWSPPSGIMLHTPTLSFIMGVDVYDCILVINNLAALESITRPRVTLGEDVRLTAGPSVRPDSSETDIVWKDLGKTVLTYLKARGQQQTVNLNGCILTERGNENERFYTPGVTQMDILAGNVTRHVEETQPLFEVIKMAEGRTDFDPVVIEKLAATPAPGDAVIATPKSTPSSPRGKFGIPNVADPDPFGVLALEMAGLEIREAGTRLRPSSNQFDFNPSPANAAVAKLQRQSVETFTTKSNRGSYMSTHTTKSQVTDAGTQTDVNTPDTSPSPGQSEDGVERLSIDQIAEVKEEDVDYTTVDLTPLRHLSQGTPTDVPRVLEPKNDVGGHNSIDMEAPKSKPEPIPSAEEPKASNHDDDQHDDQRADDESDQTNDADDEDDESEEEEPVVFEVAAVQPARKQAVASRMIQAKGSMVTIPKRLPPPLPTRSPARLSRSSKTDMGGDVSGLQSPLRQSFGESDLPVGEDDKAADPARSIDVEADHAEMHGASAKDETFEETRSDRETTSDVLSDKVGLDDVETRVLNPELHDSSELEYEESQPAKHANINAPFAELDKEESGLEGLEASVVYHEKSVGGDAERHSLDEDVAKSDDGGSAEFHDAETEKSDSVSKEHASSIYTGLTEDHWSHDGSSITTSTSDQAHIPTDASNADVGIKAHEEFYDQPENAAEDKVAPPAVQTQGVALSAAPTS